MSRPDLTRVTPFYHKYIELVPEEDLTEAFHTNSKAFFDAVRRIPVDKQEYRYAEGKWTIKEILQHLIDAERVFSYRALCFARKDSKELPGFDENEYAARSKANNRNWSDLLNEFITLRSATQYLFHSFDDDQLDAAGVSGGGMSNYVLGIGFIILGHCNHHLKIIEERYL